MRLVKQRMDDRVFICTLSSFRLRLAHNKTHRHVHFGREYRVSKGPSCGSSGCRFS